MLSVPRALTSKSVLGSSREVVTATCPARWRTASCLRTCSGSAAAFLTSSLMKAVRWGYRVSSHFRLRSVPGRLRLSSSVANQPSLIRWIAALTPRKPAPPVIRIRRSGSAGIGGRDLVLVRRSDGSIAALTLAGGYASEEGDAHDPGRAREHQRFAPGVSGARIQVGAGQKQRGENPVDHVPQPWRGVAAQPQRGRPEQPLDRRDAPHDQVGRPKSAADALVAEVVVRSPESKQEPEHEQDAGAVAVQEGEYLHQSGPPPKVLASSRPRRPGCAEGCVKGPGAASPPPLPTARGPQQVCAPSRATLSLPPAADAANMLRNSGPGHSTHAGGRSARGNNQR